MKLRNRTDLYIVATVLLVFVLLIFSQAGKKFVLDEIDFPNVAKTISETGYPYEYRGEAEPKALGLWHPPLYAYAMGGFVKLFGFNENMVRAFGMLCTLVTAALCLVLHKRLFSEDPGRSRLLAVVFLPLFLFHPYTIANATLPDIDSTVLPPVIVLFFVALASSFVDRNSVKFPGNIAKDIAVVASAFAITLWAKLTTPLVLIPVLAVFLYLRHYSMMKCVLYAAMVALLGGFIFLCTYALYCFALDLPFDYTFRFLIASFTKNSSEKRGLAALALNVMGHLSYVRYFLNWIGLPLLFLFCLAVGAILFKKGKSFGDKILLLISGFGLFVSLFYLCLTGAFGNFFKYPYPVFALLLLVAAHFIVEVVYKQASENQKLFPAARESLRGQFGLIGVSLIAMLVMGVYQVLVGRDSTVFENQPIATLSIGLVVCGALLCAYVFFRRPVAPYLKAGVLILFSVVVASEFGISRSQAMATYPTKYHYGQSGMDETVNYLKGRVALNEPVWSMKDIGQYVGGKYVENYPVMFQPLNKLNANIDIAISVQGVRYFIVTKGIGQDRVDVYPDLESALRRCCQIDKEFGNFVIYKAKNND